MLPTKTLSALQRDNGDKVRLNGATYDSTMHLLWELLCFIKSKVQWTKYGLENTRQWRRCWTWRWRESWKTLKSWPGMRASMWVIVLIRQAVHCCLQMSKKLPCNMHSPMKQFCRRHTPLKSWNYWKVWRWSRPWIWPGRNSAATCGKMMLIRSVPPKNHRH